MCCLPVNQVEERKVDTKDLPSQQNAFEEIPPMEIVALAGYNKDREDGALFE